MKKFEENFLWGGAISNVQAEGEGDSSCGKGANVYDALEVVPELGQKFIGDSKVASNHFYQFKEDISLMKEMGFKAYRFSIVWSRINPTGLEDAPNFDGLRYYDEMIDTLLDAGIEPVVSLVHFDMPVYLSKVYNGFLSDDVVNFYIRHVEQVAEHYKDRVKWWITYNELNTAPFDSMSYLVAGAKRPSDMSKPEFFHKIFYNTMVASARATKKIKEIIPDAHVSGMMTMNKINGLSDNANDSFAAYILNEFNFGLYADVFRDGVYPEFYQNYLMLNDIDFGEDDLTDLKDASALTDYLPISCYQTRVVSYEKDLNSIDRINELLFDIPTMPNPSLPMTHWGWTIDPVGFREELFWLYHRCGDKPLFIVENGIGLEEGFSVDETLDDYDRIDFHKKYIEQMHNAIYLDGVKILGYLVWSPIDILSSHKEMGKRYGFIYIAAKDEADNAMKRIPKKSFFWYKDVIQNNGISI